MEKARLFQRLFWTGWVKSHVWIFRYLDIDTSEYLWYGSVYRRDWGSIERSRYERFQRTRLGGPGAGSSPSRCLAPQKRFSRTRPARRGDLRLVPDEPFGVSIASAVHDHQDDPSPTETLSSVLPDDHEQPDAERRAVRLVTVKAGCVKPAVRSALHFLPLTEINHMKTDDAC